MCGCVWVGRKKEGGCEDKVAGGSGVRGSGMSPSPGEF